MQIGQSFHISAGWLIDGTGGPVQEGVILEISRGRIASIRKIGGEEIPPSDHVDLTGCTLLPGLVDSHVHLAFSGTDDASIRARQLLAPFDEIKPVIERHLREHLLCGVVAVRDGGDHGGYALRYGRECRSPEGPPVLIRAAGRAWHAPGRYGGLVGRPPLEGRTLAGSIEEEQGPADHVKIVNSGINSLMEFGRETSAQFCLQDLREAVMSAGRLGLRTMVHANGEEAVRFAVEAGCDSLEHGFFMGDDNLAAMAERQITWVPTVFTMAAYARLLGPGSREGETAERNLNHQMEQIRRALQYGVPIAAGTDAGSPGVHHGRAIREEIGLLQEAGFSPQGAIRCATLNGARLIGRAGEIGRISPGMCATLVALRGAPEELPGSLSSPDRVYVDGVCMWRAGE